MTVGSTNTTTVSIPKAVTLGASGTTVTIPSGATITNNGTQTGFGGTNTPYFFASITSNQTVTNDVTTKVNFDRADVDSATGYDTTNKRYTIPSGQGGYWHIGFGVNVGTGATDKLKSTYVYPKKNGDNWPSFNARHQGAAFSRQDGNPLRSLLITKSFIATISAGDYIEIFCNFNHTDGGSNTGTFGEYYSHFWGYRLVQ